MKILLADDNLSSRVSVADFLRKIGCQVDEYEDGYSALKGFLVNEYGMVLTDIKMPNMTGLELLKSISASPYWNNVDVVLFTGYGDLDSAIQALRLGAYDYLLKPLDVKELAEVTKRVAKRRNNNHKKINILLLHNNSLFGEGLKYIFAKSNKFKFIGEEETFEKIIIKLETSSIDILLIDLEYLKLEKGNFCKTIKSRFPNLNIVLLYSQESSIFESIK
ncbi:MAG: response regulator, partial [Peptococcales bacterium]